MKKERWLAITGGLLLMIFSMYLLGFYYLQGMFFAIGTAVFGLMLITGIFQNRKYHYMAAFFWLVAMIFTLMFLMLVESFVLVATGAFPGNMVGFTMIWVFTGGTIYSTFFFIQSSKKYKVDIKNEIIVLENDLPVSYKVKLLLGYAAIFLLFLSRALEAVLHENFNTTIWGPLSVSLIFLAFLLEFYSFFWLIKRIRTYPSLKIHFYVIFGLFIIWACFQSIISVLAHR